MTRPDLDALEKLADGVIDGWSKSRVLYEPEAATIKALIAELEEARVLLENIHERATEGHKKAGCDNWRAVERCRQIANLTERAFLARNGKGEG